MDMKPCEGCGNSGAAISPELYEAIQQADEELCGDTFPEPPEYGAACYQEWYMAYSWHLMAEQLRNEADFAEQQRTITRNQLDTCLAANVYPV